MHVTGRRHGDETGTTLIELLVVMILLSVVGAIIATTMIGGMRNTRQTQNRAYSVAAIQVQLERIARDLRVADPIRAASTSSITVDDYRGGVCSRRQWVASGTTLTLTTMTFATWAACTKYPSTSTPTSTTTATALSSLASTSVFSYRDSTGATLTAPSPAQIATVDITLKQSLPEGRAGVTFTTSVGVRNESMA